MTDEILLMRDEAYKNILEEIANADDPDKLQKLANAASQLEKGINDSERIANEQDLESRKIRNEELAREDEKLEKEAQAKAEHSKNIFDSVIKAGTLLASIGVAIATFTAEESSYIRKPKLLQQGLDLLRRNK